MDKGEGPPRRTDLGREGMIGSQSDLRACAVVASDLLIHILLDTQVNARYVSSTLGQIRPLSFLFFFLASPPSAPLLSAISKCLLRSPCFRRLLRDTYIQNMV